MGIDFCPTFTITVDVFAWMKSTSDASKQLLLSYLEDIAESLEFRAAATAAALVTNHTLWFTFSNQEDAEDFSKVISEIYRMGGWLSND